ncbi:hypothetical protein ACFFUB_02530 [Algimonas porphyrae]|uniref:XRE family transcriptional regulator n=1 Tax=Algimonas porphyrae TaxID=1128113 RepID=A0ABQ5V020_9PROT|nr:hypothetical protein [Algimonas porphyrae]GLQ20365.1 hypothetical protein GCM10007854_13200 [Algimonas porphyrae]
MTLFQIVQDEVASYLEATGLNATELGKRAMRNPNFVHKVQRGENVTVQSLERLRDYMRHHAPAATDGATA